MMGGVILSAVIVTALGISKYAITQHMDTPIETAEAPDDMLEVTTVENEQILPPIAVEASAEPAVKSEVEKVEIAESVENVSVETEIDDNKRSYNTTSRGGCTRLTPSAGVVTGPSGKETYYNLPMEGVVELMHASGNSDEYHVREDGVKMLGNYVMVAANLDVHPRGSLVETSLGMAIVCDTGSFSEDNPDQVDVAVDW